VKAFTAFAGVERPEAMRRVTRAHRNRLALKTSSAAACRPAPFAESWPPVPVGALPPRLPDERDLGQELRTVRVSDRLPDKVRDGLIRKVAFEFIPGSNQTP
jgi:hypothetical protein